jgi:ankyrin repeat protein
MIKRNFAQAEHDVYIVASAAESGDLLTPLGRAAASCHLQAMDKLLALGAKIDALDGDKMGAIHQAAKANQSAAVLHLVHLGVSIDEPCGPLYNFRTPLMLALLSGGKSYAERESCAMVILAAGADPTLADRGGHTPLHAAAYLGMPLLCSVLMARGADPNAKNKYGDTPLSRAASCGWTQCMRRLVARGAMVNAVNNDKQSAMHIAAQGGFDEACQLLVELGSKTRPLDKNGSDPSTLARQAEHEDCAAFIDSMVESIDIAAAMSKKAANKKTSGPAAGKPRI